MNAQVRHGSALALGATLVSALVATGCADPPVTEDVLRPVRTPTVYASGGAQAPRLPGAAAADRRGQRAGLPGGPPAKRGGRLRSPKSWRFCPRLTSPGGGE